MKDYTRKKRYIRLVNFYNKCKFLPGTFDVKVIRRNLKHETIEETISEIMFLIYTTPPADLETLRPILRLKLDHVATVYALRGFERYKAAIIELHGQLLLEPQPLILDAKTILG